ncbi:NAD(P)-binding protein [Desulfofundulus thermobenzoicus]|uniref:NAD(P)-binding protein n=1 Tax=Desulfofundulus thermobenzoicus TaxID=29376 RepID=A0A6N7IU67_9FIRM|nr:FAD-dependent oxidoreductase [Desulfofundulus thermobenzoicus]MQL53451.1 NAD(P)-binding protein [Desulfofundulus thermobenzoicus]
MKEAKHEITGAVMVVGGGISGIQASLDLAESGYRVYLVERSPAIGGTMPMLDKTFPTNDCAMCTLSPKLVECGRHRNIEVLTLSEVTGLTGEPGNFTVTVKKHPRYVDTAKCVSCGACAEACPAEVSDGFNQGLDQRKAIYKLYPQAYPNAYVVDRENCLECMACVEACPSGAIDHDMEEEEVNLNVGAVILCPGFEPFNAELRGEFGYGVYDNVITSLQFERMLSASGPYGGHIRRPSDGAVPQKIAFIQCVGSRDVARDSGYCSGICCMYATKQALIAREHIPDTEVTIFYMDIRAYGKDFEKYYNRARNDCGVQYVNCMISTVKELQQSKKLRLRYQAGGSGFVEEDFDLVVLSVGLKPRPEAVDMAGRLGIDLNEYNFCRLEALTGVLTSRPGVYVAGAFSGPKDIPETVMQASAAAGEAAALLAAARNTLVAAREFPPERDTGGEEPRIGVFVCHCGINIGSVVDVPAVVKDVQNLPHVVHAQENLYACSQDSQAAMRQIIREKRLNRVVVASCSPRTHRPLFQETLRDAGLNPHLFAMANIRDQCSWVHSHEPEKATAKALDLTRAAVCKAALLQPVASVSVPVEAGALVVGGGVAGMTAALSLAEQGYSVEMVEKEDRLGGMARRIRHGLNGEDIPSFLEKLAARVTGHPLINVHTGTEVVETGGYAGNFTSKLSNGRSIKHGVTVIATGAVENKPEEYLYGRDGRVVTQLELDEKLALREPAVQNARSIVMIQCVGSREEGRPYCSRVCCSKSVQLALRLKEQNPEVNIYILYRDMRTYVFFEDHYRRAREEGVIFIRYEPDQKPVVSQENGRLRVFLRDPVLEGEELCLDADLLVLAPPVAPAPDNQKLSRLFRVPLNGDGFFLEAHMKLRPVDFPSEGIYLCGLAHAPKNMEESITQAKAAAGRAATILSRPRLESGGVRARVIREKCAACLTCVRLCPYNAPHINPCTNRAEIEALQCRGCGTCAGECPNKAIELMGYNDRQQMAGVHGMFLLESPAGRPSLPPVS